MLHYFAKSLLADLATPGPFESVEATDVARPRSAMRGIIRAIADLGHTVWSNTYVRRTKDSSGYMAKTKRKAFHFRRNAQCCMRLDTGVPTLDAGESLRLTFTILSTFPRMEETGLITCFLFARRVMHSSMRDIFRWNRFAHGKCCCCR